MLFSGELQEESACSPVGRERMLFRVSGKRAHALQWEESACSSVGRERMLSSGKGAHALQWEVSICSSMGNCGGHKAVTLR